MKKENNKLLLFKIICGFISGGIMILISLIITVFELVRLDLTNLTIAMIILPSGLLILIFFLIMYIINFREYTEEKIGKLKNIKRLIYKLFLLILAFIGGITYGFLRTNENKELFGLLTNSLYIGTATILVITAILIILSVKFLLKLKKN
ncbi:MAG TPA: hypothetical protein P5277_00330 [Candidatus Paceibacterota bacterium]|nr:hypothetical protein [Candidatus Paceibacterota bacterium]